MNVSETNNIRCALSSNADHSMTTPAAAGRPGGGGRVVVQALVHRAGAQPVPSPPAANNSRRTARAQSVVAEPRREPGAGPRERPVARIEGQATRPDNERRGRGLVPTAEQAALVELAAQAANAEMLEEAVVRASVYLGRFSRRREGGERGGARRPVGSGDRRARQGERPGHPVAGRPVRDGAPLDRPWVGAATRIQRLFRQNRRRAVQEVISGPTRHCEISVEEVQGYFESVHAERAPGGEFRFLLEGEETSPASCDTLCAPFSNKEVVSRLSRMSNSAPGPDGVTYADLRRADPGCHVLVALFNACLRTGVVPRCWKNSITVLLHKKGERSEISNWRPIAMGDTAPKLLSAVLADRLTCWATSNKRLSPSQKGFLQYEGCYEHNFVLQEILQDARLRKREVVVAWLDLTNAFGSVPHASIHEALRRHGVPEAIRSLIHSAYDGVTTTIRTAGGVTQPVPILSGVKQGCPLSPVVFNLTLEPVLRAIQAAGGGYKLGDTVCNNLVYADDAALVAGSPGEMKALLRAAEEAAASVGLRFNPSKCATLHMTGRDAARVRRTQFPLQGEVMRPLAAGEPYQHLGIPTGFQIRQTPVETLDQIAEDLQAVDQSLLAPWQKLETAANFILPRMDFCLRGAEIEKGPLNSLDKVMKRMAKRWMHLPQRASAEVVFLPPTMGGGGLLPLGDMADLLTITHAFKMLHSKDEGVSRLAMSSLRAAASRRFGRPVAEQDLADYLSGVINDDTRGSKAGASGLWSRARNAARRIAGKLGLRWKWSPERNEFSLECRRPGGGRIVVPPGARAQLVRRLRAALVDYYRSTLLAKPDQGKVYDVTSRSRVGNHFLRGGSFTRFAEWRFIHRARLDVLPLNATKRWQVGGDKRCRKCGAGLETVPHVIQHCRMHQVAITRRHDAVLDRLAKAAHAPGTIAVNRSVQGVDGDLARLRPDLVIRDEVRRHVSIIDVAIPFENRLQAFNDARGEKLQKYHPLAENLRGKGYSVTVDAFLVGALGAWDPANERILGLLGVNRRYAVWMRRLMISDTIRWSRNIYVEHVSGVRQY